MSLQLIYGKHILIEFLYIKIQNTKKKILMKQLSLDIFRVLGFPILSNNLLLDYLTISGVPLYIYACFILKQ